MTLALNYWGQGSKLVRRGQPDRVIGFPTFDPGEVKPLGIYDSAEGPRNVGPRSPSLIPYYGDLIIGSGQEFSYLEVFGRVLFTGQGRLGDSIVHGQTTAANAQDTAINGWNGSGLTYNLYGSLIDHVRIDITNNNGFTNGIDGGNYTFQFGESYGGVDAFGFNSVVGNARVHATRAEKGFYTSWWNTNTNSPRTAAYTDASGRLWTPPFPAQSSGDTHSDVIQLTQGAGYEAIGCNLGGARAVPFVSFWDPTVSGDQAKIVATRTSTEHVFSCFQISSASGAYPVGLLAQYNWLQGGAVTCNMAEKPYDHMDGIRLLDNKFYRPLILSTGAQYGYPAYFQNLALPNPTSASTSGPGTNLSTFTGNTWADNGAAVTRTWWNK